MAPVKRRYNTRGNVVHYQITPAAADDDIILAYTSLTASAQGTVAASAQPDVARALVVTGDDVGMAGNVVITGRNVDGATISETFALNGSSAVTGSKAFARVDNIALPAETASGNRVKVGTRDVFGLPCALAHNTVILTLYNNTVEGTPPTVAVDADEVEKNTVDLNSAIAGAVVDVYFLA